MSQEAEFDIRPSVEIFNLLAGTWITQSIYAVAKLGVPEQLADGPRSVGELAQAVGAEEGALFRILRALCTVGLFSHVGKDSFELTALGARLRPGVPGSMHAQALISGDLRHEPWGSILHTAKTGEPAFRKVHGTDPYSFLKQHPDLAAEFNRAMAEWSSQSAITVARAYDFSSFECVVDVGGGNGALLEGILTASTKPRGVLFELPHVLEAARRRLSTRPVAGRIEFVAGNFFESVPAGGDAYIMSQVVCNWSDEEAVRLLSNCRSAMKPGNKLLICELDIPAGNEPSLGKLLDIHMLAHTTGGGRTSDELLPLLERAGFRLDRIVRTSGPATIVEAS